MPPTVANLSFRGGTVTTTSSDLRENASFDDASCVVEVTFEPTVRKRSMMVVARSAIARFGPAVAAEYHREVARPMTAAGFETS